MERIEGTINCRPYHTHYTLTLHMHRCCNASTLTLTCYRHLYSRGPALQGVSITVHGCHDQVVLFHQLSVEGDSRLYLTSGTVDVETVGGWGRGGRGEGRGGGERKKLMKHEQYTKVVVYYRGIQSHLMVLRSWEGGREGGREGTHETLETSLCSTYLPLLHQNLLLISWSTQRVHQFSKCPTITVSSTHDPHR